MNIFVLDQNPKLAAQMLFDKHVVKMALETAQILSTINNGPYRKTHEKHPCVIWAGSFKLNYRWLCDHGIAICKEYTYRFGKIHKCQDVIEFLYDSDIYRNNIPSGGSAFVQCMPEVFKHHYAEIAYRNYYRFKARELGIDKWTKRGQPEWWNNA
jgi:hypothetical protein